MIGIEDRTVIGVVAIVGLVVVWVVNCLTLRIDSVLASAVVSSITGIVTYVVGYKHGAKKNIK